MHETALDFETGTPIRWSIDGDRLASVEPVADAGTRADDALWVAPSFWDIQTNGRWGISFSDPSLTTEQVAEIVRAQSGLGTARICPTLITASHADMLHGVATIGKACDRWPDVAARILGIHLEGPAISERDGFRGAHPLAAVRGPDWDEFQALQAASGGRVVLTTLAPERPGAIDYIRHVAASGVLVAIGHTAADGPTLAAAVVAGARLSTHLGNGIASPLPRHPNPIWEQAANDALSASLIADGHHLDPAVARVLARAKGPRRLILVSDASPLAGLPPGEYGNLAVHPSGKVVVTGTEYLAGSSQGLDVGLDNLLRWTDFSLPDALATVGRNPARLLGQGEPIPRRGASANLVVFRRPQRETALGFELVSTCVDGIWTDTRPGL
jgi:N-acetylglucosamine-6-phosphate deacetylase